jgi:hypothetical protein
MEFFFSLCASVHTHTLFENVVDIRNLGNALIHVVFSESFVMPCGVLRASQHFRGTCHLDLQGQTIRQVRKRCAVM